MATFAEDMQTIVNNTTLLSFPFLAGEKRKQELIDITRQDLDTEILALIGDNNELKDKFLGIKDNIWKKADAEAKKQFTTLPKKLKINSFYLQELAHNYTQMIMETLS